ncbi:hypothetical protein JJB67_14925 [Clostridium perfringens]|jgi:hypothetical protein|uniref:ATP-binding protein n=2 Tax=Clostridium perfringens TaxID=1502 RepID=A0ABD4PWJ5_CLOPF|nr:hypothetical protein [Clostridium perfringens]EHK2348594.1 hypothetical protein [Clostridium perfringens]ELC8423063.1 hypothetical protein [Clostridium perfringens]MBO3304184.1 hypothetical protein [Clostridium perfringens]MBO3307504.1 hypothetical protein [Clostridium perfringens]MBO3310909.1 hypothetical protein [Clostridium perfringens]
MDEIYIEIPKKIENNIEGFQFFCSLFQKMKKTKNSIINLDFNKTRWLEANLSSILGAIISVGTVNNKIKIIRISNSVSRILSKNSFLKKVGIKDEIEDTYGTTIKYAEFKETDRVKFQGYLKSEFIPGIKISMSEKFKRKLRLNLEEVFQNARIHGRCDNIHVCGQYFFQHKKVMFTIVDLGRTIVQNYNEYFCENISAEKAIDWVTKDGNSTKDSDETGGIGLFQLREFLKENGGKIQIISSNGYWEECGDNIFMHIFNDIFDGTIVNIEVNVNDKFYLTENEKNDSNELIFDIDNIF